jgi:glycerophosphoryl diester phosphodiesterase
MAAFAHALALGFRYAECDVRATADEVAVVFHDAALDRLTGAGGLIQKRSWSELRSLRVGGEPIPTLEELLSGFPDMRFVVELKCDRVVEPVIRLLDRMSAHERVCVGSFEDQRIRRARGLSLGPLCASLGRRGAALLRLRSLGVPVTVPAADCVQVPIRYRGIRIVDRRFVAACHRAALPVQVWTVNDVPTMEWLLKLGVDGIMSDRPSVLRDVLMRRGLWSGSER